MLYIFQANGGEAQSGDVAALTKEVESLTATVKTYGERIKALEDKLADYENTVLNANQDQWVRYNITQTKATSLWTPAVLNREFLLVKD